MKYFPEELVEHVFSFLDSHRHRNTASLVCKTWYRVEQLSRRRVLIRNCHVVSPERLVARFPRVRSLTLKRPPYFIRSSMLLPGWPGNARLWIEAVSHSCPELEELHLKRMAITDECLEVLARSFPNVRSLALVSCEGFSTDGLAAIATHCKLLRELDLHKNINVEERGEWLSCFPDSFTSLVSLNFSCFEGEVNAVALERLVARCTGLRSLRLNHAVSLETLSKILAKAPQLVDLGTGSYVQDSRSEPYHRLVTTFMNCEAIRSLSGFQYNVASLCLPAVYPICSNLTALKLSRALAIGQSDLIKMIRHSMKLQKLWVTDHIGDKGLGVVASTCKELQELRVYGTCIVGWPNSFDVGEEGLLSISMGCPKLNSVLYTCQRMTNAALIRVAKNCPNFICFRLCIHYPWRPDSATLQLLDEGFGAIVQSCKDPRRLSVSALLTNGALMYIGMYGEKLEMLCTSYLGNGDRGMLDVLNGCKNLRKLDIRHCLFGVTALLKDVAKYETLRSLRISSYDVTRQGCKILEAKMPMLNVEAICYNPKCQCLMWSPSKCQCS